MRCIRYIALPSKSLQALGHGFTAYSSVQSMPFHPDWARHGRRNIIHVWLILRMCPCRAGISPPIAEHGLTSPGRQRWRNPHQQAQHPAPYEEHHQRRGSTSARPIRLCPTPLTYPMVHHSNASLVALLLYIPTGKYLNVHQIALLCLCCRDNARHSPQRRSSSS